jgi:predicted O-methyltransferase YrrM
MQARAVVNPEEWAEAWRFTEAFPAPAEAVVHAAGSDVQEDVPLLYALGCAVRPAVIVELGTRQGTSTRTLAFLAKQLGAYFYTVDPDPGCRDFIKDILHPEHCIFLNMTGEHAFSASVTPSPDLLFIDTDPHTYGQTKMWLETWVRVALPHKGVAAFHDTVPARPEIEVGRAVDEWVIGEAANSYIWRKFPTTYGMGILWKQ